MATFTLSDVKSFVGRKLHGTSISKVEGFYTLAREAGANVLSKIRPKETQRINEVSLYDSIYEVSAPADFLNNGFVDVRPQANRSTKDNFNQYGSREFDYAKPEGGLNVEYDDANQTLRIKRSLTGNILINDMDSLTANGTWAAEGGGSNATVDATYFTQGSASINFDVASTGGAIANSTMTQVDLANHDEISSLFARVYIPDSSIVSSMNLRWGNDSGAYWERTVTAPHSGSFRNGWQWIRFDWNGATETGTVAPATIDYLRLLVTTTASDTDIRVDEIRSVLPYIYELVYYSSALFRPASGSTWLETPTADTDIVNLGPDSFPILGYEMCYLLAQEIQGGDASFDASYFYKKLYGDGSNQNMGLYAEYQAKHPSELLQQKQVYYRV